MQRFRRTISEEKQVNKYYCKSKISLWWELATANWNQYPNSGDWW